MQNDFMSQPTPTEASIKQAYALDWKKFLILNFLFAFGFSVYNGVFPNFLDDVVHAGRLDVGRLESIREIPGLLAALMAGILIALAESRVAALGLCVMGVGIGLSAIQPTYWPVVGVTVFWSIGFHIWSSVSSAIALILARDSVGGKELGKLNSISSIATTVAIAASIPLKKFVSYNFMFYLGGVAILLSGLMCFGLSKHSEGPKRERLIIRKEYWLFYLLTFLDGCRRQVLSTFAIFTLILVYKTSVETMLILQLISLILSTVCAPKIGMWIDTIGEKTPLKIYSVGLILIFAGYTIFTNPTWLYVLLVIDRVFQSFSIGISVHLRRIVRPGELSPSVAMGVTMNHVAAVTLPWLGAYLWQNMNDYRIPFYIGIFIAIVALYVNRYLPDGPVPDRNTTTSEA